MRGLLIVFLVLGLVCFGCTSETSTTVSDDEETVPIDAPVDAKDNPKIGESFTLENGLEVTLEFLEYSGECDGGNIDDSGYYYFLTMENTGNEKVYSDIDDIVLIDSENGQHEGITYHSFCVKKYPFAESYPLQDSDSLYPGAHYEGWVIFHTNKKVDTSKVIIEIDSRTIYFEDEQQSGGVKEKTTQLECPSSCDDNNPCTKDYCDEATGFECKYDDLDGAQSGCSGSSYGCKEDICSAGECIKQDMCTSEQLCCSNECTSPVCSSDADCDDNDPLTEDSCESEGTCYAECEYDYPETIETTDGSFSGNGLEFDVKIEESGSKISYKDLSGDVTFLGAQDGKKLLKFMVTVTSLDGDKNFYSSSFSLLDAEGNGYDSLCPINPLTYKCKNQDGIDSMYSPISGEKKSGILIFSIPEDVGQVSLFYKFSSYDNPKVVKFIFDNV